MDMEEEEDRQEVDEENAPEIEGYYDSEDGEFKEDEVTRSVHTSVTTLRVS